MFFYSLLAGCSSIAWHVLLSTSVMFTIWYRRYIYCLFHPARKLSLFLVHPTHSNHYLFNLFTYFFLSTNHKLHPIIFTYFFNIYAHLIFERKKYLFCDKESILFKSSFWKPYALSFIKQLASQLKQTIRLPHYKGNILVCLLPSLSLSSSLMVLCMLGQAIVQSGRRLGFFPVVPRQKSPSDHKAMRIDMLHTLCPQNQSLLSRKYLALSPLYGVTSLSTMTQSHYRYTFFFSFSYCIHFALQQNCTTVMQKNIIWFSSQHKHIT